jgi:hypothetical protein
VVAPTLEAFARRNALLFILPNRRLFVARKIGAVEN